MRARVRKTFTDRDVAVAVAPRDPRGIADDSRGTRLARPTRVPHHHDDADAGIEPRFDRSDICEAYYCFAVLYHEGQWSSEYAILSRLNRVGFRPGQRLQSELEDALGENARAIFDELVRVRVRSFGDCTWCYRKSRKEPDLPWRSTQTFSSVFLYCSDRCMENDSRCFACGRYDCARSCGGYTRVRPQS